MYVWAVSYTHLDVYKRQVCIGDEVEREQRKVISERERNGRGGKDEVFECRDNRRDRDRDRRRDRSDRGRDRDRERERR